MKTLECRIAARDCFTDVQGGHDTLQDGYWAYVNCPKGTLEADHLWVENGDLCIKNNTASAVPLKSHDHFLLKIQRRESRNDYTLLPFHTTWKKTRQKILAGDPVLAQATFVECCQEIAASPDLTTKHAYHLIQSFQANHLKDWELFKRLKGFLSQPTTSACRGISSKFTPEAHIDRTVGIGRNAGLDDDVLCGLLDVKDHLKQLPHLQHHSIENELTDSALNDQLKAMECFSKTRTPNPQGLADAIAFGAFAPTLEHP